MKITVMLLAVGLLLSSVVVHGKEDRWSNFAEDADQKYYLDQKSVIKTPESTSTFWVKSVAKSKEYFKSEYNLNDLAYILTSYELDCARGVFRVREAIMYSKNRKELHKTISPAETTEFEPVTPESVMELARDTLCNEDVAPELVPTAVPTPKPKIDLQ